MRPIFSPSARIRLRSPSAVGEASCILGASVVALADFLLLRVFLSGGTVTAVGAAVGLVVALTPTPPGLTRSASESSFGWTTRAVVATDFRECLATAVCSLFPFMTAGVSDGDAGETLFS